MRFLDKNIILFIMGKVVYSGDPSIDIALTCRAFNDAARVCMNEIIYEISNWLKNGARQLYSHFHNGDERLQFNIVGWLRMRLKMCGLLPTDFKDDNNFRCCLLKLINVSKEMHGALTDSNYKALAEMSLPAKLHFLDIGHMLPVPGECDIDPIFKNSGFSAGATDVALTLQMGAKYMSQEERNSVIDAISRAQGYISASLQKKGDEKNPVCHALTYLKDVTENLRKMRKHRREEYLHDSDEELTKKLKN